MSDQKPKEESGHPRASDYDYEKRVAMACQLLCEGKNPTQIKEVMEERLGVKLTREMPYRYIQHGAQMNWLKYESPQDGELAERIKDRYLKRLETVVVPRTGELIHTAHAAASQIIEIFKKIKVEESRDTVHLGVAGGYTTDVVCKQLAHLYTQGIRNLPTKLVLHSIASGFDSDTVRTDPNVQLSHFENQAFPEHISIKFVTLNAPAIIDSSNRQNIMALQQIVDAKASLHKLDVLITSIGDRNDEHSAVRRYYDKIIQQKNQGDSGQQGSANDLFTGAKTTWNMLQEQDYVGDILWQPISSTGIIDIQTLPVHGLSLISLQEIPGLIKNGTKVMVIAAPCAKCHKIKTNVVKALLTMDEQLLTHLIIDRITAGKID